LPTTKGYLLQRSLAATGEYTLHVFIAEPTSLAGTTACPTRAEAHVARQPIFDRNKKLFTYELLYRHGNVDAGRNDDGDQATASVVTASFLDIALQRLVGESSTFINAVSEELTDFYARSVQWADSVPAESNQ
jgi:hypothetical protein